MQDKNRSLSLITAPLEQALAPTADDPPAWIARMDRALAGLERAADGHGLVKVGRLGEVSDLIPSPGFHRRLGQLREALGGLVEEAGALRDEMRREAARAPWSMAPSALQRFHRRAAALLLGLEEYEQEEARLLLESVNTDIGAGD